jgi:hypothetical protein
MASRLGQEMFKQGCPLVDTSIQVTNLLDNKHKGNGVHYQGMSNECKASV